MKKIMICLFALGMIAWAQELRAEVSAPEVTAQAVEATSSIGGGKKVANRNNLKTVSKTKKYWNKNARSLRKKRKK